MYKRIEWIDQVKGFAIFLVVYGHNFPFMEKYIYSFHMPLFFLIAGFFHPRNQTSNVIIKRIKQIIVPYFLWSSLLFLFWLFLGRFYGNSVEYDLSPLKNFIGIFYAQGDRTYMDWGIPMWFLPTIFLSFLLFYLLNKIKQFSLKISSLIILSIIGFILPIYFDFNFIWSLDVAMVSLLFYGIGFYSFKHINSKINHLWLYLLILGIIHFSLFNFNEKIDMYRSIYGNQILFIISGVSGSFFYLLLFKMFPKIHFLSYLGNFTIPILAMQLRALTIIKFFIIFVLGISIIDFTEVQKFLLSLIQILIMLPVLYIINKYIPILNGKNKKY